MPMIADRVRRALTTVGSRNALTPLVTASTPVIAVQPLANARKRIHHPAVVVAARTIGGATSGVGCPLETHVFKRPMAITLNRHSTNRDVGSTNTKPDQRTPRSATRAIKARLASQHNSVCA